MGSDRQRHGESFIPVSVEVLLKMGYPKELVFSTYHRLLSTRQDSSATAGASNAAANDVGHLEGARPADTMMELTNHSTVSGNDATSDVTSRARSSRDSEKRSPFTELTNHSTLTRNDVKRDDAASRGSYNADVCNYASSGAIHSELSALELMAAVDLAMQPVGAELSAEWQGLTVPVEEIFEDGDNFAEQNVSARHSDTTSQEHVNDVPTEAMLVEGDDITQQIMPAGHSHTLSQEAIQNVADMSVQNEEQETRQLISENNLPTGQSDTMSQGPTQKRTNTSIGSEAATPSENTPTEEGPRAERRLQLNRLRALRTENRRLRARKLCRHCHVREVSLTLLPCGHFCFCQECGSTFTACPLCRKTILADVRTFVS